MINEELFLVLVFYLFTRVLIEFVYYAVFFFSGMLWYTRC